jgi:tetratricopeptide (TPR) repeat protein
MRAAPSEIDTVLPAPPNVNGSPVINEKQALDVEPSYACRYPTPPALPMEYDVDQALEDIPGTAHALELFLASKMHESEDYCDRTDPDKSRLYFATGYGLIQCVKGLMSYEDEDLLAGISHTKHGNLIASKHRKPAGMLPTRLAGYFVSAFKSSGTDFIANMNPVERHAELVYAESLFEKSLLGIVYSGDWLSFIKEALSMRATITIYKNLGKFIQHVDSLHPKGHDPSIDVHFRSGVDLGNGLSNIILSLLPSRLLTIIELFGYKGDRDLGLELLARVGGWTKDSDEPSVSAKEEGLRRTICDMGLLLFHLVISSFTFEGIDLKMAKKVLDWNLKRYPSGVFFLFGAGRLALMRSQPKLAIEYYNQATEVQSQYRNLHHISFWEIAIANLALWDIEASHKCWKELEREATWSKAIYSYGTAVCLLEIGGADNLKEATRLMEAVPSLRQRIAGKSIPLEKFVARKSRKFTAQSNRLILPALEIAYLFLAIAHAPRSILTSKMIPETDKALEELKARGEKSEGYWDDWCLATFLRGVCLRYVACPDPDAVLGEEEGEERDGWTKERAGREAREAFEGVFKHGTKIELDHHLVYYAHYELGRLLVCLGDIDAGRRHFEMVLSGKPLEVKYSNRKGKYSMENALHMRTFAAVEALKQTKDSDRL